MDNSSTHVTRHDVTPKWSVRTTATRMWPVLLVLVAGLASGFRGIDNQTLWYDELETAYAVRTGVGNATDPYTIPYYLILRLLTMNGVLVSDVSLRGPSAVAMAIAGAVVAFTALRLTESRTASLVAGGIFVLAPGALRLAHEARPYAFAALGGAVALFLMMKVLERNQFRDWLLLGLTTFVTVVIAPIAVFMVATLFVVVLMNNRKLVPRFVLTYVWLLPVGVLAALVASRYSDLRSWLGPPSLVGLRDAPIWISTSDAFGLYGATAFGVALLALALTSKRGARILVAILAGVLSTWLASFGPMSFWTGRTFIIFLPALALAASLSFASSSLGRGLSLLLLLGIVAQPAHAYLREPGNRGPDWEQVASQVATLIRPGDQTDDRILFLAVSHYAPSRGLTIRNTVSQGDTWVGVQPACDGTLESGGTEGNTYFICRE